MRFDVAYQEDVQLRDGTRVSLRLLGSGDRKRLEDGLLRMSEQSRYLRFFTAKVRFTERELDYLTDLDGHDHFALGAVVGDDVDGDGVAVARFVRLEDEPEVAEPAIAVIDEYQRKGLGSVMMVRLVEAARERGIERFRTEFLASNTGIRELLDHVEIAEPTTARFETHGSLVTAELWLVAPDEAGHEPAAVVPEAPGSAMAELLRMAAGRTLELRSRFQNLFVPSRIQQAWDRLQGRDKKPPASE